MSNRQTPKIFTALDFSDPESAWSMYQRLKPLNPYFKIGLELFAQLGVDGVRRYSDDGAKIFLDLKFHDIPNTVKQAIMQVNKTGAVLTNIHIAGGEAMSRAALSALPSGHGPKLIAVTILTSLADEDMTSLGWQSSAHAQALRFAELAKKWDLHGVVCSAHDVAEIKKICGPDFLTIVPGIRSGHDKQQDQKRTMNVVEAKNAGADFLVIGRPITQAAQPEKALGDFLGEL